MYGGRGGGGGGKGGEANGMRRTEGEIGLARGDSLSQLVRKPEEPIHMSVIADLNTFLHDRFETEEEEENNQGQN